MRDSTLHRFRDGLTLFLVLIAGILALALWRLRREESESRSALDRDLNRIAELQTKLNLENKGTAPLRTAADGGAGGSGKAPSQSRPGVKVVHVSTLARDNPQLSEVLHRQLRAQAINTYHEAVDKLDLPSDVRIKLMDLLGERSLITMELGWPSGVTDANSISEARENAAEIDRQIGGLIGSDVYEQLKDEAKAAQLAPNFKSAVNAFAAGMADDGVSMTPDQSAALLKAYSEINNPVKNPGIINPTSSTPDTRTYLTPQDQALLDRAADVLSPAQLANLQTALAEPHQYAATLQQYFTPPGFRDDAKK